jgi:primosomal protein N' (replication factor Y) (superfamily II helicase)
MSSEERNQDAPEKGETPSLYVKVAVYPLDDILTYSIRAGTSLPSIGTRVHVPLGRRKAMGFVVGFQRKDEIAPFLLNKIRPIEGPLTPFFDEALFSFLDWIARYYGEPLSHVLETALPGEGIVQNTTVRYSTTFSDIEVPHSKIKGTRQREILSLIQQHGGSIAHEELTHALPRCQKSIALLLRAKHLTASYIEDLPFFHRDFVEIKDIPAPISLSPEQLCALGSINDAVSGSKYRAFLLHGITGSGKTEVYIEAVKQALLFGKSALILVPEISLTPQLIDRFQARLSEHLAVLHSQITKNSKWTYWQLILKGKVKVVIGARSALFAPLHNLGLIIVDEEHEGSFKQNESFRYNARDLALARAKLCDAIAVLGSATPSLETFYRARKDPPTYLPLTSRPQSAALPYVEIIDLLEEGKGTMVTPHLSTKLFTAIEETLEQNEQVFLLYNRRGFAHYLQCIHCGYVVYCPHCSVTLTYHDQKKSLQCHYCGYLSYNLQRCVSCKATADITQPLELSIDKKRFGPFHLRGGGTEKIFDEIVELFPTVSVGRLDRDTVKNEDTFRDILGKVRDGSIHILVGTQMIAKGHDIANVTLVGVIDCDVSLHMPDFRAGEKTFQLLTQVSGRAGRGEKPGRVFLQTRAPGHTSIQFALRADYNSFARYELFERRNAMYPPFTRLLRIITSSEETDKALSLLHQLSSVIGERFKDQKDLFTILGPAPAPLQKLKSHYRFHLLIKCSKPSLLSNLVHFSKSILKPRSDVKTTFDLDPYEML